MSTLIGFSEKGSTLLFVTLSRYQAKDIVLTGDYPNSHRMLLYEQF